MIHIYHGNGKGKTTAAIGLSIRAAGAGKAVIFAQFMKGRDTSELKILNMLSGIRILRIEKDFGFSFQMTENERQEVKQMHNRILDDIIQYSLQGKADLVVLDEITHAYRNNMIDKEKLKTWMEGLPNTVELVITGRDPDAYFLEHGDYITNMICERHPYDKNQAAREGIEY